MCCNNTFSNNCPCSAFSNENTMAGFNGGCNRSGCGCNQNQSGSDYNHCDMNRSGCGCNQNQSGCGFNQNHSGCGCNQNQSGGGFNQNHSGCFNILPCGATLNPFTGCIFSAECGQSFGGCRRRCGCQN